MSFTVRVNKDPNHPVIELIGKNAIGSTVRLPHKLHCAQSSLLAESGGNKFAFAAVEFKA